MTASLLLGAAACGTSSNSAEGIEYFVTMPTERVYRNIQFEGDKSQMFSVTMAKNEREGKQIVLRPNRNIWDYTVEVSSLCCGDYVIPAENVDIYNVKYISTDGVSSNYLNDAMPSGAEVPDALLPFDTAAEYEENRIAKHTNQGIYIEISADKAQPAGTYTGEVAILADGARIEIPVSVTVIDYEIPDSPSTMNYFARWGREHYASAELDCTDEIDEIYFAKMLEYRMSSQLPFEGEGGPERYVELLRKYYNVSGFSCYKFFYEATYSAFNDTLVAFNAPLLKTYLKAVAQASVEDRTDYFSKAIFYFSTFVDEPDSNPLVTWDMVREIAVNVKQLLVETDEEIRRELSGMDGFEFYLSEVSASLLGIPNIIPGSYSIETLENAGAADITSCAGVSRFDTETMREGFRRDNGLPTWWYTGISPQYPYPNMLANNYPVIMRLLSWMQIAYDIDGYLLWDAVNYTHSDNNGVPVVDNYGSLSATMSTVSDGKLFYPGAPYGITGPVPSLRAVAYRDGMEDFELLQMVYDLYEEKGLDAADALSSVYAEVFSGTVANTSSAVFESTRLELIQMLEDIDSDLGVLYKSIDYRDSEAEIVFTTTSPEAVVRCGNIYPVRDEDGFYTVRLDSAKQNYFTVTVSQGESSKTYTKYIFGAYRLLEDFESGGSDAVRVNASSGGEAGTLFPHGGNYSYAVSLNGKVGDVTYRPWFGIAFGEGDTSIADAESIIMHIYNAEDEEVSLYAAVRYEQSGVLFEQSIETIVLSPGWNYIEIAFSKSVRAMQGVQQIRFNADNITLQQGDIEIPGSIRLYIDDIAYRSEAK